MDQVGQSPKGKRAVKQVFFTRKPGALYAITAGWPGAQLVIHKIRVNAGSEVGLLGVPGLLRHEVKGADLVIHLPVRRGDEFPCQPAYAFKLTGVDLDPE